MSNIAIRDEMAPALNLLGNTFKEAMEVATVLSQSDLIPLHFQKKPANIFIALQMAARQNLDPFLVMQSIYVVHGRPGFEGKFLIALANRAGWGLQFKTEENSRGEVISCQAIGEKNGVKVPGPKVTWEMVQAEGWDKPKGSMVSKWNTLRSLMFIYRAGSFFVNTVCPELRLGLPTAEELEDITPLSITTAPLPEAPAQEDPEPTHPNFIELLADYQGEHKHLIPSYLEAASKHNKTTPEAMQEQAAGKWTVFIETFEKWATKQAAKAKKESAQAPPPPEPAPVNGNHQAQEERPATGNLNGPKIVNPVSGEMIAEIISLIKAIDYPEAALLDDYKVSDLMELDFETAAEIIGKLKG